MSGKNVLELNANAIPNKVKRADIKAKQKAEKNQIKRKERKKRQKETAELGDAVCFAIHMLGEEPITRTWNSGACEEAKDPRQYA